MGVLRRNVAGKRDVKWPNIWMNSAEAKASSFGGMVLVKAHDNEIVQFVI
jgi:hypothetical protein